METDRRGDMCITEGTAHVPEIETRAPFYKGGTFYKAHTIALLN